MNEVTQSQGLSHRIHTKYHNPTMNIPILNPISKSLFPAHEKHTPQLHTTNTILPSLDNTHSPNSVMSHLPAHSIRCSSTHSILLHPFHFDSSLPRSPRRMLNKHAKQSQGMKSSPTTTHSSDTNSSLGLPSPHLSSHTSYPIH